jgi:peptidoglycan/LPS O-acetylase OafA/YrhL
MAHIQATFWSHRIPCSAVLGAERHDTARGRCAAHLGTSGSNAVSRFKRVLSLLPCVPTKRFAIDDSFWSLGLEWQSYFLFALILWRCVRTPSVAFVLCLAFDVAWQVVTNGAFTLSTADYYISGATPARLIEFCCGVLAARAACGRTFSSDWQLVSIGAFAFTGSTLFPARCQQAWYGVAFACRILLIRQQPVLRCALSWKPLAFLGLASYSVYLVHEHLMQMTEAVLNPAPSAITFACRASAGILAGILFYWMIERPVLV